MVIMCNMTVIICTSCQTRNICLVASPWSRRLPLDSLHQPGAHASYPPNQEWKGPGIRQHPSRVSYPLWPKMSGMAQALRGFYSNCFSNLTKPKIWRKATVIAIPKFNTPTDDPKNYRLISLLCVPFKLLARLLLARLEPIIDPHSPDEQADFRRGRNTVHQIVNLTEDIEETFENGHKAGVILVDLTAEYDTVWHQGLTLKLFLTITLCGSSLLSSPTAALHSRQATDRSADCVDSKNGVPGAQSWLRYYLTFTSAISLLPRHPITHICRRPCTPVLR